MHRERLNKVATKHGLPPLSGTMTPTEYLSYALDLMVVELGLMDPKEVSLLKVQPPKPAERLSLVKRALRAIRQPSYLP